MPGRQKNGFCFHLLDERLVGLAQPMQMVTLGLSWQFDLVRRLMGEGFKVVERAKTISVLQCLRNYPIENPDYTTIRRLWYGFDIADEAFKKGIQAGRVFRVPSKYTTTEKKTECGRVEPMDYDTYYGDIKSLEHFFTIWKETAVPSSWFSIARVDSSLPVWWFSYTFLNWMLIHH